MKQIIFIFNEGRKTRLKEDPNGPKEFFYTYQEFKKNKQNVDLLESNSKNKKLVKLFFRLIRKITKLPIYTENFTSLKSIKKILDSETIFATNQNLGFSILPILYFKKIFKKSNFYVFSMGLIENISQTKSKFLINTLFDNSTKLLFISKSEQIEAKKIFPQYKDKFTYIPFSIDTEYWKPISKNIKKEYILFIGNDMNRDFEFVSKLSEKMQNHKFLLISEKISKLDLSNVRVINGNWNKLFLSDDEIKEYYSKSLITILPLKQTFQPSGQSVALQSISMGTPVLITSTKGFWDYENFKDKENILFINENKIEIWEEKINNLLSDSQLYTRIVENGKNLIKQEYNLNSMYTKILEEITKF